ncbi:MAG TPA: hypothetical protein VFV83_03420 [Chthoniobacteraceae bacterium]|nr:hypothetical protein [Chthoniobacteraceae bacterium]
MKSRLFSIHPPLIAAAVLTLLAFAGFGVNIHLAQERKEMRGELTALRGKSLPADASERTREIAAIASLSRELASEEALLAEARQRSAAISRRVPSVEQEQLRSFGHVEQMGQEAALFIPQLAAFMKQMQNAGAAKLPPEESARMMNSMMGWMNRLEAIGELETNPAEIARFHAVTLEARLGLGGEVRAKVEQQLQKEFAELNTRGLARPQRPVEGEEDWYQRRNSALHEATQRVESLIPPGRRQQYVVGQSLYLGTGLRSQTTIGADGHGSVKVGLALPGLGLGVAGEKPGEKR